MIQSIEIKNFKSIKHKFFPLRNLNLLLGLNGMGKSSFIQMLLLLRQSKDSIDSRVTLNGELVNLGSSKDALYQYAKKGDLSVSLKTTAGNLELAFEYLPEADYFSIKGQGEIISEIANFISQRESIFGKNFQYLFASRQDPASVNAKNFTKVVNLRNLGNRGEFTSHYIEVYGSSDEVQFENMLHKDSTVIDPTTGFELVNRTLINQINLWMGEISPGVNIRTTSISSDYVLLEYVFKQPNFGNTNRYKPENVGFGISYVLPVVTALLAARRGELLIIENPESHIHPRGQAELGKLMALAAMNDIQIVIETHSDHILNGIRVAVKEGDILGNDVIAFYFKKIVDSSEQYSEISNIEIDDNGELSEYPKDLLDEWSNQLVKLI